MSGIMFDFTADPSTRLRPRCVASWPYGTVVYSPRAQRHALVSPWVRHRCVAGYGIRHIGAVYESAALRGASALHIDEAVGPAHDTGNQRQDGVNAIAFVWSVEDCGFADG